MGAAVRAPGVAAANPPGTLTENATAADILVGESSRFSPFSQPAKKSTHLWSALVDIPCPVNYAMRLVITK